MSYRRADGAPLVSFVFLVSLVFQTISMPDIAPGRVGSD
jgi:hypothetical protein